MEYEGLFSRRRKPQFLSKKLGKKQFLKNGKHGIWSFKCWDI